MQKTAGIGKRLVILTFSTVMLMGTIASAAAAGVDTTTLDLDRYGADVVPAVMAEPAIIDADRGPDTTNLYLDRNGADIPTANWWGRSDYAGSADAPQGEGFPMADHIRFIEENSFDYATPVTTQQIAFLEANSWDYQAQAEPAGDAAAAESAQDFRFLEENVWEKQGQMIPPAATGNLDY